MKEYITVEKLLRAEAQSYVDRAHKYLTAKELDKAIGCLNKAIRKVKRADIEIFQKHMPIVRNPEQTIDFYIEAGMLEIVEEENHTPYSVLQKSINRQGSNINVNLLIGALEGKGYKIIKA